MPNIADAAPADAVLVTSTGKLFGTLLVPVTAPAPMPVVALHAGSGPTDRDGNSPQFGIKPNTLKLLAEALAANGIASLRYDKRGIGKSADAMAAIGESDLRFDDYVGDAVAWIAQLRADSRFSRVIFAGNSEGALIGMLAAQRTPLDGFASLDGAARSLLAVLRVQLAKLPPELHARAFAIMDALAAGATDDGPIPPELAALFRPSVQPYLISEARYDPAVEIAKLTLATLIVQGTADVQIPVTDGARLHKAAPKATYVLVEGMNHVLKIAPDVSTPMAIQAGYTDPTLPIAPEVVAAMTALALG
jgi:pimeloyl-ACP methyl ester carboxylesterase